jgi:hypothetical protein
MQFSENWRKQKTMKLSSNTIAILKNFSIINPSICITKGDVLRTMSKSKNILAFAHIDQSFDTDFAIADLSQFLAVLGTFESDKYDIFFHEKFLEIKNHSRTIRYTYYEPSLVTSPPPDKEYEAPASFVDFHLSNADLVSNVKTLSILGLPYFAITGEDGSIYIKILDID